MYFQKEGLSGFLRKSIDLEISKRRDLINFGSVVLMSSLLEALEEPDADLKQIGEEEKYSDILELYELSVRAKENSLVTS